MNGPGYETRRHGGFPGPFHISDRHFQNESRTGDLNGITEQDSMTLGRTTEAPAKLLFATHKPA